MTAIGAIQPPQAMRSTTFARAIETDRTYFEMDAETRTLPGAVMAWMPIVSALPAAAVVHRVDPATAAQAGAAWIEDAERALAEVGATLSRIYLDAPDETLGAMLRHAGYVERDELVFVGSLAPPSIDIALRPVISDAEWAQKLEFHREARITPDGHDNDPADWVTLERRKCSDGMEAFLAEIDGKPVGAICAVWGDGLLRLKNFLVHPAHRRRAIGQAMVGKLAGLGRARGISEQCVLAVRGEVGELFYRALGLQPIGAQVEWSKRIGAAQ